MVVSALRICLPDFDHRVRHRDVLSVDHAARQAYMFTIGGRTSDTVYGVARGAPEVEIWADGLRRCGGRVHAISQTA